MGCWSAFLGRSALQPRAAQCPCRVSTGAAALHRPHAAHLGLCLLASPPVGVMKLICFSRVYWCQTCVFAALGVCWLLLSVAHVLCCPSWLPWLQRDSLTPIALLWPSLCSVLESSVCVFDCWVCPSLFLSCLLRFLRWSCLLTSDCYPHFCPHCSPSPGAPGQLQLSPGLHPIQGSKSSPSIPLHQPRAGPLVPCCCVVPALVRCCWGCCLRQGFAQS